VNHHYCVRGLDPSIILLLSKQATEFHVTRSLYCGWPWRSMLLLCPRC